MLANLSSVEIQASPQQNQKGLKIKGLLLFGLCVSFGAVLVRFGASLMCLSRMLLGLFMVARFMVYAGHVMMLGGLRMKIRRN
jgi:hypothetical protein